MNPADLTTRAEGCPDPYVACLTLPQALAVEANLRRMRAWIARASVTCDLEEAAHLQINTGLQDVGARPVCSF